MAVSVKMGVDVSQFKAGMQQAQQSAKTLQTQLKANEAQFKATGDKEQYLAQKSKLLKAELDAQKQAAENARKALEAMRKQGVEETSREYQQMERALAGANAAMYETQAAMNAVTVSETKAAGGANELEKNLSSIGKNVSLGNIVSGLDKITGGLESAAKKVGDLGRSIFDEIKRSAKWADDAATMAQIYEIPLDKYLRMQKLVDEGMDTTVENMLGAMDKMSTSMGKESEAAKEALRSVGLMRTETDAMGNSWEILEENDPEQLFWKFGQALKNMPAGFDKNAAATAVFGKNWREMMSLFDDYDSLEEYEAALNGLTVNSEDAVTRMAELNDRLSTLESAWNTAKLEVLQAIAPALSDAATALADLLNRVTEYLKTDEGQKKLEKMEEAVRKLFGDLSNIDPEDVVNKFAGVLDKIVTAFTWVGDHWEDVKTGLEAIGIAFGTIKIASFATNMKKVVDGFRTLWNGANKPLPQIPGTDSGTPTTTGGAAAAGAGAGGGSAAAGSGATAAKAGLFSRVGAWFADAAGVSAGGAMIGTGAIAAGVIALGETVKELNRQWRGTVQDDAHRYDNLGTRDQQVIQTTIRGIMGGESPMSREWQMRWFAQNMGGRIWDAFNYTDAGTGEQRNRLGVLLGMDNAKSAEAFALIAQAYGLRKDRMGNYDLTSSAALQSLMNSDAELNRLITGGATSYAMYQQMGNKVDYANLWQELTSFFEGSMMKDENGQYWTPELYEEKLKADEEAAANVTELGNSSENTGDFIRIMGDESETASGHVSKFGELAGGAEHSVDVMGGAAARAAGALASIHAPTWATHANGIWSVPWDGYPAILHKGERVTPAREISSRSYNSNLYVESMYMNNGTDAAGLAAAMAAAQRRTMSGYGS